MKSLVKSIMFAVILVPFMSHVSESVEDVKKQQQEAEKKRLREFFSFQLKHIEEKPATVEFHSDAVDTRPVALWYMTLRNGSGYSETETCAASMKTDETEVCTGCFRSNSEGQSTKAYDQERAQYGIGNIILLYAKQKELMTSKQKPLNTVEDCLRVFASGYQLPENSKLW